MKRLTETQRKFQEAKQKLQKAIQKLNEEFESDVILDALISEVEGTKEMEYLKNEVVTFCQIHMRANVIVAKTMEEQMKLEEAVNAIWPTENSKQNTLFLQL
jgi:hypothetical protein